jgi:excinuclease ABC subunit A
LRPDALVVTVCDLTIAQLAAQSLDAIREWFESDSDFRIRALPHFQAVRDQVVGRIDILQRLGLGYLALTRESTSLSAGEAQRIRLARQAGLGLRNVLYVFDEPSVGLHHHDADRLLDVLRAIRDAGNTVIVVEHDDHIIRQADWVVDVGPQAGDHGGEILFSGSLDRFAAPLSAPVLDDRDRRHDSPTHAYLTGRTRIAVPVRRRAGRGALVLRDVSKHNLVRVTAQFLTGAFNVVTGVSGAGKSTLIGELRLALGASSDADRSGAPATTMAIVESPEPFQKIVDIDQAPIGRTPRSNPATYTGLFDRVRELFAAQPAAVERGFDKGRFSFNVEGGRCSACEGAGVIDVGMQFLGSVAVTCDRCGGRRFNDDTLSVTYRHQTIHDVLDMSIEQACTLFADHAAIARPLDMMRTLGIGYLRVGHPATQLSGGEAQRVKLATELSRAASGHTLYLLDEPTTGLHTADVALLLDAINGLVERGHTVIAIEHHLDLIAGADHVVDLGPEGGMRGGRVVATGTPAHIATVEQSLTGLALRGFLGAPQAGGAPQPASPSSLTHTPAPAARLGADAPIHFTNVCTHNLRGIDVSIPANQLTAITGVSGSGKSSLAFDTIFAEGQQRFADSFSTYARRFIQRSNEAEFDTVSGLTPTVAISQRAPSRNPRSTVATITEIHDYCRLLFSRAGTRPCLACGAPFTGGTCGACGRITDTPLTAAHFSPNAEAGACPTCHGLGHRIVTNPVALITDPSRPIAGGAMDGHKTGRFYGDPHGQHMATLAAASTAHGLTIDAPWLALSDDARALILEGSGDTVFEVEWNYKRGVREGSHHFRSAWIGLRELVRQDYERLHGDRRGDELEPLMMPEPCAACGGARLKPEALAVRFAGASIHTLLSKTVDDAHAWLDEIATGAIPISARDATITRDLRHEMGRRLEALRDAGLGYLTLDRQASTLSGGEAQRVRLASALRSGLTGVTYVLDEPTAGLHPRDTDRLLAVLRGLTDAGNTVIVVEHDLDVIAAADHVIEIGPGAGRDGGHLIAEGSPADAVAAAACRTASRSASRSASDTTARTAAHLAMEPAPLDVAHEAARTAPRQLRPGLTFRGARAHNLQHIDIDVPAGGLVAITGVSGSGKSSLVFDVIAPSVERAISAGVTTLSAPVGCDTCSIHDPMTRVIDVERVGSIVSPWSTPATHVGAFDAIRKWYAGTDDAKTRGLRASDLSTAAKGGRCPSCEGLGQIRVHMDFLPDVWMTCEECSGRRYGESVLKCRIDGRSIADVLDMTIDEAAAFVAGRIRRGAAGPLAALCRVGLGYLRMGQPTRTLSGGERQRLVLGAALAESDSQPTLFLFDEPTKGLHADDVQRLLGVFDELIAAGHSVVVVEHHLDVIRRADHVIDLGPDGGLHGGRVVVAGTPEAVAACADSQTGVALSRRRTSQGRGTSADLAANVTGTPARHL